MAIPTDEEKAALETRTANALGKRQNETLEESAKRFHNKATRLVDRRRYKLARSLLIARGAIRAGHIEAGWARIEKAIKVAEDEERNPGRPRR